MTSTQALRTVSAQLSQLKTELRQLYVQWCVGGPTLESSSALAAMAQEESGHARILGRLAAGATGAVQAPTLVPIERVTSWPELVGTVGPLEIMLAALIGELKDAGDLGFGRNVGKIAVEERHHAQFFLGWFQELGANRNAAGASFAEARAESEARIAGWLAASAPLLAETGIASVDAWRTAALAPDEAGDVVCVHCGSHATTRTAAFGASLMTELRKCDACGANFESVRWKPATA
jgi:hypothetical protein